MLFELRGGITTRTLSMDQPEEVTEIEAMRLVWEAKAVCPLCSHYGLLYERAQDEGEPCCRAQAPSQCPGLTRSRAEH